MSEETSTPVGVWELVSQVAEWPDGGIREPFGPRPSGRLVYDGKGHVMAMIVGERRNEAAGNPSPPDAQSLFTAYFGIYHVNLDTSEIVHHVTTSLNGLQSSGELRRSFNIEDDTLHLSFSRTRDGVQVTARLVWKRTSPS